MLHELEVCNFSSHFRTISI